MRNRGRGGQHMTSVCGLHTCIFSLVQSTSCTGVARTSSHPESPAERTEAYVMDRHHALRETSFMQAG